MGYIDKSVYKRWVKKFCNLLGDNSLMGEGSYKASKGLIRVKVHVENDKIKNIRISGDFFMYPEDELWKLEDTLVGTSIEKEEILLKIRQFYKRTSLLTPGVNPEDFTEAVMRAVTALTV